jgi:acyl carrier protein
VVGELYIGGAGLARGYCNQAGSTAEKFVPHPFSQSAGERLYRTGDLVRWNGAGELEFLGRKDQQVKLRGYRIELGEVEAVLSEHEAVRESVIVAQEDVAGEKRLVAYVVLGEGRDTGGLRDYLRQRLPDYMVPAAFVVLEKLPLTVNGKVDRKALPMPEGRPESVEYVAPRTPMEEMLADIWTEVFGVGRIGMHDNFFELGGHSILATIMISRMRKEFGIKIPLKTLFEAPTLREFAERVQAFSLFLKEDSTELAMITDGEEYDEGVF